MSIAPLCLADIWERTHIVLSLAVKVPGIVQFDRSLLCCSGADGLHRAQVYVRLHSSVMDSSSMEYSSCTDGNLVHMHKVLRDLCLLVNTKYKFHTYFFWDINEGDVRIFWFIVELPKGLQSKSQT